MDQIDVAAPVSLYFPRGSDLHRGQEEYNLRADQAVYTLAEQIRTESVNLTPDSRTLFDKILERAATLRQSIAIDLLTPNSDLFGKLRVHHPDSYDFLLTNLESYSKYYAKKISESCNVPIVSAKKKRDRSIIRTRVLLKSKHRKLPEGPFFYLNYFIRNSRTSSILEVSLKFSKFKYTALLEPLLHPEFYSSYGITSLCPSKFSPMLNLDMYRCKNLDIVQEKSQKNFEIMKLNDVFLNSLLLRNVDYYNKFHENSVYLLIKRHLQIGGIDYPLTSYLLNRYEKSSALVVIIHQDLYLLKKNMDKAAELFHSILVWDKKDILSLMNKVGKFLYLFSHICPYERGSAAISEWLERAVYQVFNFKIIRKKVEDYVYSINLAAFAYSYEDYRKDYLAHTTIAVI